MRIVEHHLLPAGDVDAILRYITASADVTPQFEEVPFHECAKWCEKGGNQEAAAQVMELGLERFPDALVSVSLH
jgi:hypothetical protein